MSTYYSVAYRLGTYITVLVVEISVYQAFGQMHFSQYNIDLCLKLFLTVEHIEVHLQKEIHIPTVKNEYRTDKFISF